MNAIEKYTNDKFIRLLNSFLKKICEPSFKKEFGDLIGIPLPLRPDNKCLAP